MKKSPQLLKPGDHGVGRLIADASFKDVAGTKHRLSSLADQQAIVFAMTSTSCPAQQEVSAHAGPACQRLFAARHQVGVVNPMATDKNPDIQAAAESIEGQCDLCARQATALWPSRSER